MILMWTRSDASGKDATQLGGGRNARVRAMASRRPIQGTVCAAIPEPTPIAPSHQANQQSQSIAQPGRFGPFLTWGSPESSLQRPSP